MLGHGNVKLVSPADHEGGMNSERSGGLPAVLRERGAREPQESRRTPCGRPPVQSQNVNNPHTAIHTLAPLGNHAIREHRNRPHTQFSNTANVVVER